MNDIAVDVLVVPVAALPAASGAIDLVAYKPGGRWIEGRPRHPLKDVATELLSTSGPPLLAELVEWSPRVDPITFVEHGGAVSLLFTVALPMTTPLVNRNLEVLSHSDLPKDWVRVGSAEPGFEHPVADEVLGHVLEHWRQLMEETTAVFELLPRYFTTPQVRALYEAVWGQAQDAGNFHKWFHGQRPAICHEAHEHAITEDIDGIGRRMVSRTPVLAHLSLRAMAPKLIGTSPRVLASSALGAAPGVSVAGAVAGGVVAYQAMRKPGKQPEWFEPRDRRRRTLSDLYPPRPTWASLAAMESQALHEPRRPRRLP